MLIFAFCFLGPLFYHTDQVHVNLANENLPPGADPPPRQSRPPRQRKPPQLPSGASCCGWIT